MNNDQIAQIRAKLDQLEDQRWAAIARGDIAAAKDADNRLSDIYGQMGALENEYYAALERGDVDAAERIAEDRNDLRHAFTPDLDKESTPDMIVQWRTEREDYWDKMDLLQEQYYAAKERGEDEVAKYISCCQYNLGWALDALCQLLTYEVTEISMAFATVEDDADDGLIAWDECDCVDGDEGDRIASAWHRYGIV